MAIANTQRGGTAAAADAQAIEFGAALRQTRLSHGRDLADVARQLRIRQPYLHAIEDGRFEDLPGPTYAIGFVRAYADYLGLEEGEVVKRYKELRGGASAPANLVPPAPVAEGRLPTGPLLLLAALLAAVAYGGWYYLSMEGRDPGELVTALPDRIAAMVGMKRDAVPGQTPGVTSALPPAETVPPAPSGETVLPAAATPAGDADPAATDGAATVAPAPTIATAPPQPAETSASGAPPAAAAVQPAPEATPIAPSSAASTAALPSPQATGTLAEAPSALPVTDGNAAQPPAAAPAPPAPPAPDQMAARGDTGSSSRVVLRAEASSWVEIRNAQDHRVFSRLMRAGEIYAVPPTPGLSLTTGNAGGLSLVVDGRTLPPLGRTGDVRRDLALDAETLLRTVGSAP